MGPLSTRTRMEGTAWIVFTYTVFCIFGFAPSIRIFVESGAPQFPRTGIIVVGVSDLGVQVISRG